MPIRDMYEVVVGNIGRTYMGHSLAEATANFYHYKKLSIDGYGRAAGESVVLFRDGEPELEHSHAHQSIAQVANDAGRSGTEPITADMS